MKFKAKLAVVLASAAVLVGVAATAATAQSSAPAVSTGTSPTGLVYGCAVDNAKFSSTIPLLDYHGTYTTGKKCGAGHQIVVWYAGTKIPVGATGKTGPQGPAGPAGPQGEPGKDAAPLQWGVANVMISRGGPATTWATVSTPLGSPAAMGSQGTAILRFTCKPSQAPCAISQTAYAQADKTAIYARVDIHKQDYNTGADAGNCEYSDGSTNDGGSTSLSTDPTKPTAVPMGIGSTGDCGVADQSGGGVVDSIEVPAGFYDVSVTDYFGQPTA